MGHELGIPIPDLADGGRSVKTAKPVADHPHRWLIETPNGATSQGVCRTCGEERTFYNSIEQHRLPNWGGALK